MFWTIFYALCEQQGKKPLNVVNEIGISHGSITNWKKGSVPNGKTLQKLADYFGVSVSYLLGDTDTKEKELTPEGELSDKAMQLVKVFDSLDEATQDAILEIVERIVGKE